MSPLKATWPGFKLGVRIADSWAMQHRIDSKLSEAGLHAIKGIANQMVLEDSIKVFGVNNTLYTEL